MNLKAKLMTFTAAVAFSATMASAAITADDLIATYQNAAFTSIQVTEGPTQIKVEAVKNGVKLEVIYDKETGAVVKRERNKASEAERSETGVEVSTEADDFTDGTSTYEDHGRKSKETHLGNNDGVRKDKSGKKHTGSDDSAAHDVGDDHGTDGASHDVGDDHGTDGASHDVGDDHGTDGASHDVGDDHGTDGASHDVGDDHGTDGASHDAGDDHGSHGNSDDSASHDSSDDHGNSGSGKNHN